MNMTTNEMEMDFGAVVARARLSVPKVVSREDGLLRVWRELREGGHTQTAALAWMRDEGLFGGDEVACQRFFWRAKKKDVVTRGKRRRGRPRKA